MNRSGGDHGNRPLDGRGSASPDSPYPVDVSRDRRTRGIWLTMLGGPVTWFLHFMLVYLVAEAGCTGEGPGLRLFDPPVPALVTGVATVVATILCLLALAWVLGADGKVESVPDLTAPPGAEQRQHVFRSAGAFLWGLSAAAVLFVGVSAAVFTAC